MDCHVQTSSNVKQSTFYALFSFCHQILAQKDQGTVLGSFNDCYHTFCYLPSVKDALICHIAFLSKLQCFIWSSWQYTVAHTNHIYRCCSLGRWCSINDFGSIFRRKKFIRKCLWADALQWRLASPSLLTGRTPLTERYVRGRGGDTPPTTRWLFGKRLA